MRQKAHVKFSVIDTANGMQKWHIDPCLFLIRHVLFSLALVFLHFVESRDIDALHIILVFLDLFR